MTSHVVSISTDNLQLELRYTDKPAVRGEGGNSVCTISRSIRTLRMLQTYHCTGARGSWALGILTGVGVRVLF